MIMRLGQDGRMSDAVLSGNTLYIGGQICVESDDIASQAEGTLGIVEDLLTQGGSDKEHLLFVMIYLRNIVELPGFNAVWDKWISPGHEPARACVSASMYNEKCLVEVFAVAEKE